MCEYPMMCIHYDHAGVTASVQIISSIIEVSDVLQITLHDAQMLFKKLLFEHVCIYKQIL